MKKIFDVALVCVLFCQLSSADSSLEDLSESNRLLTGKVEVLEKKLEEMEKKFSAMESAQSQKAKEEASAREAELLVANKKPEDVIKTAKKLIEEGSTAEARGLLSAFISKNPGNIYSGMMAYYVGKSFFLEKDYQNAAIEYMKSYKTNPKGSKSAAALYKLALCFKQLNEMDKHKTTLEKIVDEYPGPFSKKASQELKTIKNAS
ncbi:MAG: tetratricopeptide repeat protein [Holosporaceae bacterium]|jgi:TolA-binding protein|nr:tetratricopeptide repeat protein [Holosporaceae bacterium]